MTKKKPKKCIIKRKKTTRLGQELIEALIEAYAIEVMRFR